MTEPQTLDEIAADKGYHSNQTMVDLDAVGIRSYIAEPDRVDATGHRCPRPRRRRMGSSPDSWTTRPPSDAAARLIERSFAHLYDTGGMRRTHLRGHTNILKRLLIHAGGFNLGLLMRAILGAGTPRGFQDRGGRAVAAVLDLIHIDRGPLAVKVVT